MIWVEARYRRLEDGAPGPWAVAPRVPDGADVDIPNLTPGHVYEVQARRVNDASGESSPWVPMGTHEITYGAPPPEAVTDLRVVCGKALTWAPSLGGEDRGLRFRILHAPGVYEHYQDMVNASAEDGSPPPFDLCLVPKGPRTICVLPVDAEGQEGEPRYLLVDRGPFADPEAVDGRTEEYAPAWNASNLTITNGSILNDEVVQDTFSATAMDNPFYIGGGDAPFYRGDPSHAFYCETWKEMTVLVEYLSGSENGDYDPLVDGAVLTLDPVVDAGENWRAEYRPRVGVFYIGGPEAPFYRGSSMSSKFWHGVDGASRFYGAAADPFYVGGDLDPFWDMAPWLPWPGRLGGLRPSSLDIRLVFPASPIRATLHSFATRETLPARPGTDVAALGGAGQVDAAVLPGGLLPAGERVERGVAAVTATPGPTSVTFGTAFLAPPTVLVGLEDQGGDEFAWQFTLGGPSKSGFSVRVYDAAGAEVFTGKIHWQAQGR